MHTSPDPTTLRDTLAGLPTGVTIVTVRDELDDVGMTATSFTCLSLTPPLVGLGVDEGTHMHEVLERVDLFGVSVLAAGQKGIAARFGVSGRPSARLLVGDAPHHRGPQTGAILLDGAVMALECRTLWRHAAGDHTFLVAEILAVDYSDEDAQPLVRHRRRYRAL